jgi:hypothetical protein
MFHITRSDNTASMTTQVENNRAARPSLLGPAAFAAALAVAAFVWLVVPAANDRGELAVLSAVAFVLTAALGVLLDSHVRAARRFNDVLDVYAGKEIVRAQRWKELARAGRQSRQGSEPSSPMFRSSAQVEEE